MHGAPEPSDDAIRAVILDMDGVVTDTARAHFAAWKAVFDELLSRRGTDEPFTLDDYLAHVDGLPRRDGVRRFLASRDIVLPEGTDGDEGLGSVQGIGRRKNDRFRRWLDGHRVPVFDDARAFIDGLKRAGLKVGVFSASRNAARVLESAGVARRFDAVVGGDDARALGLAPKPSPDELEETAHRLGCAPAHVAVVEDAVAGVRAGAAGHFAAVIGMDRHEPDGGHRHALRASGADLVTRDLRELLLPGGVGLRTLDGLPLVWDELDRLRARLASRRLAVFLDYDGTLSPIVADYREATMNAAMRAAVARLAERHAVAIISGRDLADVRERVGLDGVICAGSHGFDIAGPDGLQARPDEAERFLDSLASAGTELSAALAGTDGARVERKRYSVAVHFRQAAPRSVGSIEGAVDEVLLRHADLRASRGKKVLEIQPRTDWDKGRAIEWLLAHTRLGEGDPLALYIGDDLTDEDAFGALAGSGVRIAVRGGGRVTLADYALADPDDVRRFVDWLADRDGPGR